MSRPGPTQREPRLPAPPMYRPDDSKPPFHKTRGCKWLGGGCCLLVVLAVGGLSIAGFWVYRSATKSLSRTQPLGPATPAAKACFTEVARATAAGAIRAMDVGDVDSDGQPDVVVLTDAEVVVCDRSATQTGSFHLGHQTVPTGFGPFGEMLPAQLRLATLQGAPAVVVHQPLTQDIAAFRPDGQVLFRQTVATAPMKGIAVADLDGDGEDEVLVPQATQGAVTCLDGSGAVRWRSNIGPQSGGGMGAVTVADVTGDGQPDVLAHSMVSGGTTVLDATGQQTGQWSGPSSVDAMLPHDLDGDGRPEFLAAAQAGVFPGAASSGSFEEVAIAGLKTDGTVVWDTNLGRGWAPPMRGRAAAGDFDGDGQPEWAVGAPDGTVRFYDMAGKELGRQAMGDYVTALAVEESPTAGGKDRLWVGLGSELVCLEWVQW